MDNFIWVEKYRPKTIDECVLPDKLQQTFDAIISRGEIPNMLFAGPPGVGKTTVAFALCSQLHCDSMLINASEESGIDVLRGKIRKFASSRSLDSDSKHKVVILDEADYLNPSSTQPSLRGFIEEFSASCRFILTCNFKNRIIEPLHSRCSVIDFSSVNTMLPQLAHKFMLRMQKILKGENINYEDKALAQLIINYAPDWRRVLNETQRHSMSGKIDNSILSQSVHEQISPLFKALSEKDFKKMRKWVADNAHLDAPVIFRQIYDHAYDHAKPASVPNIVLILADYMYKNAFVADKELNMAACFTELMGNVDWK